MDDAELARRSIHGFGEMLAVLGRWGPGAAEVRRPDAVGARIAGAGGNPWFDAAVVPFGTPPPADDPLLPLCLWAAADVAAGRADDPNIATPCLGVELAAENLTGGPTDVGERRWLNSAT